MSHLTTEQQNELDRTKAELKKTKAELDDTKSTLEVSNQRVSMDNINRSSNIPCSWNWPVVFGT